MPPRRLQRALPETGRRSTPSGCATSPCSAGAGYSRSRRPHQPWPQSHRQPGGKYTHAHTAGERVREKNKPKSQSPPSTSRSLAYLPRVLLEPVELVYPRGRPLLLLLDLTDLGVAHEAGDVRNGTPQRGLARRRLHPPLLLLLLLLLLLRPSAVVLVVGLGLSALVVILVRLLQSVTLPLALSPLLHHLLPQLLAVPRPILRLWKEARLCVRHKIERERERLVGRGRFVTHLFLLFLGVLVHLSHRPPDLGSPLGVRRPLHGKHCPKPSDPTRLHWTLTSSSWGRAFFTDCTDLFRAKACCGFCFPRCCL